jgi:hypothetical protein
MVRGRFSSLFDMCHLLVGRETQSGVSFRLPAVFENLKKKISFFLYFIFPLLLWRVALVLSGFSFFW